MSSPLSPSPLKGESLHTRLHVHCHQFSMSSKFKIVKQICEVRQQHDDTVCMVRLSEEGTFVDFVLSGLTEIAFSVEQSSSIK